MDSIHANINKLVSLTFDESPEVRKKAAKSLSEVNDPAAVFALVELSFDKDPSVRTTAQSVLDGKRQTEPELMSFAAIFSAGGDDDEKKGAKDARTPERPDTAAEGAAKEKEARERILRPITQIFEKKLGKEKAEMAKNKMMPSIEKIYLKSVQDGGGSRKDHEESGRQAMQEFLTSYLEVMSDLEQVGNEVVPPSRPPQPDIPEEPEEPDEESPADSHKAVHPAPAVHEPVPRVPALPERHGKKSAPKPEPPPSAVAAAAVGLEEVGKQTHLDDLPPDLTSIELQEVSEMREEQGIGHLPDTYFKKAYEIMALSNGDDDVMKSEMNRMLLEATREIGLAFRIAKKRFKETKVTNITKIKDGMRNINTDPLTVKSVETRDYQKNKKLTSTLTRVLVNDDSGDEGVVYLYDGRGVNIREGMKIKIIRGIASTVNSETAIVLGKKGNVYIVL